MAFEVFLPAGGRNGIPRGSCTLTSRGMGRFNPSDLSAVGIDERATILIDRDRGTMALRSPLECEQGQTVGDEMGCIGRTVWLAGAMKAIGLDPTGFAGWQMVRVCEDRLELTLAASAPRRKARA